MESIQITNEEYDKLIKRIEFYDTTRNQLLTFSFTSVLTVLGVSLAMEMNLLSVWICLIPFFLIIPFAARISYYRLASAHINSFLRKFHAVNMQFELGTDFVNEGKCRHYKIIAWLVNHEMVLLGLATSCIFYLKYIFLIGQWNFWNYIGGIVPFILMLVVYMIADSTFAYKKLIYTFSKEWEQYLSGRRNEGKKQTKREYTGV